MRKYGYKLPRKLLKAAKHIEERYYSPLYGTVTRTENGTVTAGRTAYIGFVTKDGYPYTKWVRKAIGKAMAQMKKSIEYELKLELERCAAFQVTEEEMLRRYENFKVKSL